MKSHKILLFMGATIIFVILLFIFQNYSPIRSNRRIVGEGAVVRTMVNGKSLIIETVSTTEAIHQGLSDRDSMPLDHGMLFKMGLPDRYSFWMYHMHFPLDIIWIHASTVVDIVTLPAPQSGESPARYMPKAVADQVLELNAGQAEVYGLRIGSQF